MPILSFIVHDELFETFTDRNTFNKQVYMICKVDDEAKYLKDEKCTSDDVPNPLRKKHIVD